MVEFGCDQFWLRKIFVVKLKVLHISTFNVVGVTQIPVHHTFYIPTSPLTFPYALAPSTPKGDFAKMSDGVHSYYFNEAKS